MTPVEKLLARCWIDPQAGCWIWCGAKTTAGYGEMMIAGKMTYTHRLAHELWTGPLDGLVVDHLCRVKACFNPDHLEAVEVGTNTRRGLKGSRRIVCPEGHSILGENAYVCGGYSRCRICWNAYLRRRHAERSH